MKNESDGNVCRFAYDGLDNIIGLQDRQRNEKFVYRGLGCLIRRVEAGITTEFLYDTEEQLRAVINEHGLTYRFGLDGVGDVLTETGFDGLTRHYLRDVGGRIAELTLPDGQRTRYAYDRVGRVIGAVYGDSTTETFRYRADGALLEANNEATTVNFEYDAVGNQLREKQGQHTVTSNYDRLGRRISLTSSLGAGIDFARDTAGHISQVRAGNRQVLFTRDAQGLETHRRLSGGVQARRKYDAVGRLTEQRIVPSESRQAERVRAYSWREDDRLTQVADSVVGVTRFEHDALGNLAATVFGDGSQQLRVPDAVGNLFQTAARQDRHYGVAGQLLEAKGTRYEYDARGNLVKKTLATGEEWRYVWNSAGRLSEVVRPDGGVVRFSYDALVG